jgi:hypothetical protein
MGRVSARREERITRRFVVTGKQTTLILMCVMKESLSLSLELSVYISERKRNNEHAVRVCQRGIKREGERERDGKKRG